MSHKFQDFYYKFPLAPKESIFFNTFPVIFPAKAKQTVKSKWRELAIKRALPSARFNWHSKTDKEFNGSVNTYIKPPNSAKIKAILYRMLKVLVFCALVLQIASSTPVDNDSKGILKPNVVVGTFVGRMVDQDIITGIMPTGGLDEFHETLTKDKEKPKDSDNLIFN